MKSVVNLLCAILVTAYAYNATPRQCGNGNGITYSGTHVRPGIIAVSHDLKHLMGKTVVLKGIGIFKVKDLMHRKHRRAVDIYMESSSAARRFGKKKVEVMVEEKN